MHRIIIALGMFFLVSMAYAEVETLFGEEIESGGFGGPAVKFASLNGEFSVLAGGRGGWIINHCLIIGGGGYGLANDIEIAPDIDLLLEFGYGGFELEYVHAPSKLVHFSGYLLVGGGGVGGRSGSDDEGESDPVFVAEGILNANLNISSGIRLAAGAGYIYVSGVNYGGLSSEDLSGATFTLNLQFGSF